VHPIALAEMAPENMVMIYGPRNEEEVNVIFDLLQAAYHYAGACLPEEGAASGGYGCRRRIR
jgi:hypothetical protein